MQWLHLIHVAKPTQLEKVFIIVVDLIPKVSIFSLNKKIFGVKEM